MTNEIWIDFEPTGLMVTDDSYSLNSPFHDELYSDQKTAAKSGKSDGAVTEVVGKPAPDKPVSDQSESEKRLSRTEQIEMSPLIPDVVPLKQQSMEQLSRTAHMTVNSESSFQTAKQAHLEIIRRFDEMYAPEYDEKQSRKLTKVFLQALKEGKSLEAGPDGCIVSKSAPLSPEDRLQIHSALSKSLLITAQKAASKLDCANFMRANNQFKDAETFALKAKMNADELPIDSLKELSKQLTMDIALYDDPRKRSNMLRIASQLSGDRNESAEMLPIQIRKFLVTHYLGTEIKRDGNSLSVKFGKTTGFDFDRAFQMVKETEAKNVEILGFDSTDGKQARQDPEMDALRAGFNEILGNPQKYNLADSPKVEQIQKELKNTTLESMVTDAGVVALTATILAASRTRRMQGGIENVLGRLSPGAEVHAVRISKIAGFSGAALSAPLARHYGYKALSGVEESWSDTALHVAGSLATAELGTRIAGNRSMFTGPSAAVQRNLDTIGSFESSATNFKATRITDLAAKTGRDNKLHDLLKKAPRGPSDFDIWREQLGKKFE